MAKLFLFNGGGGGSLLIGERGVRSIPPFNRDILLKLSGLSSLLNGSGGTPQESVHEMGTLSNKLSNLIFAEVEGMVGPLEGEHSLIYLTEQGGFHCGSTGKPAVVISWPAHRAPSIQNLIAAGVLEPELIVFLETATKQKMDILEVLENPFDAAGKLGIRLSERSGNDLHRLAPSQLLKIEDPVTREVVEFFYAVVKDGRFLNTWPIRPYAVAAELKVTLSELAIDRIISYPSGGEADAFPWIVVVRIACEVVCEVVEIALVAMEVPNVADSSGLEKF